MGELLLELELANNVALDLVKEHLTSLQHLVKVLRPLLCQVGVSPLPSEDFSLSPILRLKLPLPTKNLNR